MAVCLSNGGVDKFWLIGRPGRLSNANLKKLKLCCLFLGDKETKPSRLAFFFSRWAKETVVFVELRRVAFWQSLPFMALEQWIQSASKELLSQTQWLHRRRKKKINMPRDFLKRNDYWWNRRCGSPQKERLRFSISAFPGRENFHLQRRLSKGTDIYHPGHLHGSGAHSHITLIRILWEVIPLTLPLRGALHRHGKKGAKQITFIIFANSPKITGPRCRTP